MKNVLVILAGSLLATTVKAQMPSPVDSLKISKDVSLDEVVITATKVGKETPVAYSDISKQELSSRNNGQGIPFLISQSPSVIMTSDAGTGIGYSGFRIRGTDANHLDNGANLVTLSVTDTGCGIPQDKQEWIFERFTKTNDFIPGSGLGLYLCRLIVNRLNGKIKTDPSYTKGSRFVITMPIATPPSKPSEPTD